MATENTVSVIPWGATNAGRLVDAHTLTSATGASATVMTCGATLTHLRMPDKSGRLGDVVLGFDNLRQYETQSPFFGATVGRVANRIARGSFQLDGKTYTLATNNGANHLHGGLRGYDKRVWTATAEIGPRGPCLSLTLIDPDAAEGYPGTVRVLVVYTLEGDTLRIEYRATTDRATPINLTNHAYFNLKDCGKSDVLGHTLRINAENYTPVDVGLIPTGEIAPVKHTPLDFTVSKAIGAQIAQTPLTPPGYDHNFVLSGGGGALAPAAVVEEPESGRRMEVWTTTPGMQLYTGNFLDGTITGKGNAVYHRHHGFSLECQDFPDAVNQPGFPSTILRPGQTYRQTTELRFSHS